MIQFNQDVNKNPTCSNVDFRDFYVVVDADGVTDVAQDAPQLIYYSNI